MPGKGMYETREDDERRSYRNDRIEEVERELVESEAISAEVPRLQETYFQIVLGFPRGN